MSLPHEIQRAKALTNSLNSALRRAKHFKQNKVSMDLEEAEELLQLLSDSLKTIDAFDLVEFTGTVSPINTRPKYLPSAK